MAFPMAKPAKSDRLWRGLRAIARREGLVALAVAGLPAPVEGLPSAVTIAAPLAPEVVAQVAAGMAPTMTYYHHYRTANALLDRAAFLISGALAAAGFSALPIPASQTTDAVAQAALFPHKTAATLAGIGWIGRHALLVTPAYGPRVRLATVLTDLPAPSSTVDGTSRCGACRACVEACPAGAIRGATWTPGTARAELVDARACLDYMRARFSRVGRGSVCGVCMAVCHGGEKERA